MSDKKWTRRAAIGFIGAGTGLFATDTAGFTQIEGTRSVSLDKKDDPNGLVGFGPGDGSDIAVSGQDGDRVDLFDLTNNFENDEPMYVSEIEIKSTDGAFSINNVKPEPKFSVKDGKAETVTVTGVLDLDGNESAEGAAEFQIAVNQNGTVVELDRTVTVTVQAEEFYSNSDNYSDNNGGGADQPGDNARGTVEDPGKIGNRGDSPTKLKGEGGNPGLWVGFVLPPVDSCSHYTLTVVRGSKGTDNLEVYIVNSGGDELTNKRTLGEGTKGKEVIYDEISDDEKENKSISDNKNDLFLIFKTQASSTQEIDFIQFKGNC